ncbi:MAG: CocE/NonD family hydrolase [Candidatus Rokubacteria bacterium]|nr:CocE/NonD family hydrolase [Candidatus Rokubacteria bacterium]
MYVNPDSLRTPNPSAWPQYPFNDAPRTREQSPPRYRISSDTAVRIPMRDGITLAADVFRPAAPGEKFPAVVAVSPYSRQLQRTDVAIGQNEAGLTEFWVPRGYAHVVIDVRGTNDSEGSWDMFGPVEQQDGADAIEWVARQPWCNGKVGLVGCSYCGRSQVLISSRAQPPSLTAIFPYDAATDAYRDSFFHGGIPADGFARSWLANINAYSLSSGRLKDPSGIRQHSQNIFGLRYPFDCEYFQERSSWPRLDRIAIPTYFGSDWEFFALHLRGAFSGWEGVSSTSKRMLVGPRPQPFRPLAAFHLEALRWYDHWLKGLDTGVMEGPPIQIWIPGENTWRSEHEWPLKRTEWRELFLGGPAGAEGSLLEIAGADGERTYEVEPASYEARSGNPRLVYRSAPFARPTEITGPIAFTLVAQSSATDTDWFVSLLEEAPDGTARSLTKGWLRASHRALDPKRSRRWQPWHPHAESVPLKPNTPEEFVIEVVSTCNLFQPGHRLRLEIASCDSVTDNFVWYHAALPTRARNTVLEGRRGSRLLLPFIPR